MKPIDRIVAIIPSRRSYVLATSLDGKLLDAQRIQTHGSHMLRWLEKHPLAKVFVQAPPWTIDISRATDEDMRRLHGFAETAIRWFAVAEVLAVPCQGIQRSAWTRELRHAGLLQRSDDRTLYFELARRSFGDDISRDFAEVACLAAWAQRQLPQISLSATA